MAEECLHDWDLMFHGPDSGGFKCIRCQIENITKAYYNRDGDKKIIYHKYDTKEEWILTVSTPLKHCESCTCSDEKIDEIDKVIARELIKKFIDERKGIEKARQ